MGQPKGSGQSYLKPLWHFLDVERPALWIILVHSIGVGLLSLALPVAVQSLVNTVAFGTVLQPIFILTLVLLLCLSASAALKVLQTLASEMLQRRIFVRYSMLIASRLPHLTREARRSQNVQEIVNRFFDIFLVQKALAFLLLEGLGLVLQAALGLVLLAFYHPFLLAYGIILMGCIGVICLVLGRGAIQTAVRESSAKYAMAAWLEEMARLPLALGSSSGNRQALERADIMAGVWLDARKSHFRKVFAQTVGTFGLQAVSSCVLLGFGGWLVIRKELSLGQLVAAELIVTGVLYSVAKMGKQFEAFYDVVAGLNKLQNILDLPAEESEGRALERAQEPWMIELKDASLRDLSTGRGLSKVSLKIQAGSRVLIRGSGGSGKSLLASLLYGAVTADSGQVLLQGQDARYLSALEIKNHARLVQDLELIDGTIEENLLLGIGDRPLSEIDSALSATGLLSTVSELRDGLKASMSSNGAPLANSQARRLMLARAQLARPSLLLIDKNSDWLQSPTQGQPPEVFLGRFFSSLPHCTIVVFADSDSATAPVMKLFDQSYELSGGEVRRA
ncbi:MAG: ATP-binding cassette domain-containing protein [Oligoflexia bacterium]